MLEHAWEWYRDGVGTKVGDAFTFGRNVRSGAFIKQCSSTWTKGWIWGVIVYTGPLEEWPGKQGIWNVQVPEQWM